MTSHAHNTAIPFPSRTGAGFRFTGKVGQADLTNLYALRLSPPSASQQIAEAEGHIKHIEERLAYLKRHSLRDGRWIAHADRDALGWWRGELARLKKDQARYLADRGLPLTGSAN